MIEDALKEGRENWYRNEKWSFKIECAFLAKLARTRGQGPQYLAIQIYHLADDYPQDALRLAELYFEDWSTPFRDGHVHMSKARAFVALGKLEDAADSLGDAVKWQKENPYFVIGAELAFALLIAQHKLLSRYEAANDALARLDPATLVFPLERFQLHAAHAMIAEAKGDLTAAQGHAKQALTEADQKRSPFARHPDIGLVEPDAATLVKRLRKIAKHQRITAKP